MSTLLKKIIFFLILLSMTYAHAENVGELVLKNTTPNQELTITNLFSLYPQFSEREIERIDLYIAPAELKDSTIVLKINGQSQSLILKSYRPNEMKDFLPLSFSLPGTLKLKQKDISKIVFALSAACGVVKVEMKYKDDFTGDIEGKTFKIQLDRLEKLSEQNLYAENNRQMVDAQTRILAARELAFYPSLRSALILLERYNYRGVAIDYDLRYAVMDSMKIIIKTLIERFGEEKTILVLEALFMQDEESVMNNFAVDTVYDFKSSAGIYFGIIHHIYSPTWDHHIMAEDILTTSYGKSDFVPYLEKYREKILNIFKPDFDFPEGEVPLLWARERACTTLSKAPISGIIQTILPYTDDNKFEYSIIHYCSETIRAIIKDKRVNFAPELLPLVDQMSTIITTPITDKGFYYSNAHRILVAGLLGKAQTPKAKAALLKALNLNGLEDDVKASINEALSWYK